MSETNPEEASLGPENANAAVPNRRNRLRLSKVERDYLRDTFQLFDTENKGSISVKEIREVMQDLTGESTVKDPSNLNRILAAMQELEDDTSLDLDDFVTLMTTDPNDKRSEMQKVFDMFGGTKGYITQADLEKVADEMGEDMTKEELDEMIQRASSSGDDKVTFEDFTSIMTKKLFL